MTIDKNYALLSHNKQTNKQQLLKGWLLATSTKEACIINMFSWVNRFTVVIHSIDDIFLHGDLAHSHCHS